MRGFALSETPIDPVALQRALCGDASGGYVSFEGWVRNHNDGRDVLRLEYEAYPALALAEGERIVAEAREKFPIDAAACVHRVGPLGIGDIAVWVGVASGHRAEAFAACRYIIDEIKARVPIWKHEHYVSGEAIWVDPTNATSSTPEVLSQTGNEGVFSQATLYARQTILPEVGEEGQARLSSARVLVVGAGGLGCAALPYLAAAGVGTIGVCDGDAVDISNLHRQILFTADDIGAPKVAVAAARLRAMNPFIIIREHASRVSSDNVAALLADYDYVLDCTDNFDAKFLLNDACMALGKTLIQASLYQYEGQLFVARPAAGRACFRCLWPDVPAAACVASCAEAGVLGAVAGVLGTLQAQETLKQILALPGALDSEMVFVDLASIATRRLRVDARPGCPACASKGSGRFTIESPKIYLTLEDAVARLPRGLEVLDMRSAAEIAARPLPWPSQAIDPEKLVLDPHGQYLVVCPRGVRSKYLAQHLRATGIPEVYSLAGGVSGIPR